MTNQDSISLSQKTKKERSLSDIKKSEDIHHIIYTAIIAIILNPDKCNRNKHNYRLTSYIDIIIFKYEQTRYKNI